MTMNGHTQPLGEATTLPVNSEASSTSAAEGTEPPAAAPKAKGRKAKAEGATEKPRRAKDETPRAAGPFTDEDRLRVMDLLLAAKKQGMTLDDYAASIRAELDAYDRFCAAAKD